MRYLRQSLLSLAHALMMTGIGWAFAAWAPDAWAQRADDSATRQATDAFGFSLGGESVGIYSGGNVRGYSPVAAGNVRIGGLYFDQQTDLPGKLVESTTIRVGLAALDFDLPAPSGIVDEGLRLPDKSVLTTNVGFNSYWSPFAEIEGAWVNGSGTLTIAYSGDYSPDNEFETGANSNAASASLAVRVKPREAVALTLFAGRFWYWGDEDRIDIFTRGNWLPARFKRRVAYNQPWGEGKGKGDGHGAILEADFGDGWALKSGLFYSAFDPGVDYQELYLDEDGKRNATDLMVIQNPASVFRSFSGEIRLTKTIATERMTHLISASVRGRDGLQRYGGDFEYLIGPRVTGVRQVAPEPVPLYGPQTSDKVQQIGGALSYRLNWKNVGIVNVGLQKVRFRKTVDDPGLGFVRGASSPVLFNASAAVQVTPDVIIYGGYTRGLEESGTAPTNAANRGEVLPVTRTSQRDFGLRYAVTPKLTFSGGLFDLRRPFADIDPASNRFTFLGKRRNRGIEMSLSGEPVDGLSLLLGALFLDPELQGGRFDGLKPLGSIGRTVQLNLDYQIKPVEGLYANMLIRNFSSRVAKRNNQLDVPGRTIVDAMLRYRFSALGGEHQLRVRLGNIFNTFGWQVDGSGGFQYNAPRNLGLFLTSDW